MGRHCRRRPSALLRWRRNHWRLRCGTSFLLSLLRALFFLDYARAASSAPPALPGLNVVRLGLGRRDRPPRAIRGDQDLGGTLRFTEHALDEAVHAEVLRPEIEETDRAAPAFVEGPRAVVRHEVGLQVETLEVPAQLAARGQRRELLERDGAAEAQPFVPNALHSPSHSRGVGEQGSHADEAFLEADAPHAAYRQIPRCQRHGSDDGEHELLCARVLHTGLQLVPPGPEARCDAPGHVAPFVPTEGRFHREHLVPVRLEVEECGPHLAQVAAVLRALVTPKHPSAKHPDLDVAALLPPLPEVRQVEVERGEILQVGG